MFYSTGLEKFVRAMKSSEWPSSFLSSTLSIHSDLCHEPTFSAASQLFLNTAHKLCVWPTCRCLALLSVFQSCNGSEETQRKRWKDKVVLQSTTARIFFSSRCWVQPLRRTLCSGMNDSTLRSSQRSATLHTLFNPFHSKGTVTEVVAAWAQSWMG